MAISMTYNARLADTSAPHVTVLIIVLNAYTVHISRTTENVLTSHACQINTEQFDLCSHAMTVIHSVQLVRAQQISTAYLALKK